MDSVSFNEEWKDVPTWNGVFQVSNFGRVYNTITKRFLKGHKDKDGYYQIVLYHKPRRKKWRLNRLVATVFQRPLQKNEDVHHKNQIKEDNNNDNLMIIEKGQHTIKHHTGKPSPLKGTKFSQQHRQNISKAKTGKKGTPHTQQWKRKMSERRKKYYLQHPQKKKQISERAKRRKEKTTGRFI